MATIDYLQRFPQSILNRDINSNLGKLWKLFSDEMDDIKQILQDLRLIYSIFSQSGDNLDQIGTLVLLDRKPGESDDDYKLSLSVAIAEKLSGGSIPELAEIGKIVAGNDPNAIFRVIEQWGMTGILYLDGESLLDGSEPFNPSMTRSASILSPLSGNVDDIVAPLKVGETIGKIRAAGIFAAFEITFQDLISQMTQYTTICNTLDAQCFFDGRTLLDPDGKFNIYEIALGDGATREPLPTDTGLQNEVFREVAQVDIDELGQATYTIDIAASELNTVEINELAAFGFNGLMCVKDVFEAKGKNVNLLYNYQIIDDEN